MARTTVDVRIQERAARSRLAVRPKPYWRMISEGVHIGYRRGKRKGVWLARCYLAPPADYASVVLAEADDLRDANGLDILSFKQALDKALAWIELQATGGILPAASADITVAQAIDSYIAMRDARASSRVGRTINSDAHYKLTNHVLQDRIAAVRMADLTESDLRAWQLRIRRMPLASRMRIANDFKAGLNAAFEIHRRALPADLPTVIRFGLRLDSPDTLVAVARDNQILNDEQVRKVVAAAIALDEDFGRLVVLLAATGARFSQLARMTVGDVQPEALRVMVPQSYKGKKRVLQYSRIVVGADTIAALKPAIDGRPLSAPLLERWRHQQVKGNRWERVGRGAWTTPSEMIRDWRIAAREAGLAAAVIPYSLRHSSIVRGLRAGLPIRLVAALHDTSVAMIERHYSRWITEGLDELVERALVPIVAAA